MKNRFKNKKRKFLIGLAYFGGVIIVGFFTWFTISLANQKAELELNQTYTLPKFVSLDGQFESIKNNHALAIDGEVASSSETIVQPTASTAKMILGLAVMQVKPFEPGENGEVITINQEYYDRYAWYLRNNGSNTAVAINEEISEYDALMAMFLASSNNMADTLAVWAFGSLDNYREYASKMLSEWGINDTTIGTDASGFDDGTTSTAADLSKIGEKVLRNPVLAEIVETKSYQIPVAGTIINTNKLLGIDGIIGIKTGFIGDVSGYCLITGYLTGEHIITTALLGAPNRDDSFNESQAIVEKSQDLIKEQKFVSAGDVVGYYDSWWTGQIAIRATENVNGLGWAEAKNETELTMDGETGNLRIKIGEYTYNIPVAADEYKKEPSFGDRLGHLFGWQNENEINLDNNTTEEQPAEDNHPTATEEEVTPPETTTSDNSPIFTNAPSNNCTIKFGSLMLINPNFPVENSFISARRGELVSISSKYGIVEGNPGNGDNLLDAEAATHLNDLVNAYKSAYPGHTFETRSCFRSVGTSCGRLCAATGESDHHTGLTCDLLDPAYGTSLDTDTYNQHPDWQWLRANSYKYGFIDRFPEAWAGGPMSEPANVDGNGTTGLFETWHYRYVGVGPATDIATGKYNNGQYDSLEHYLLAREMVTDLKNGQCK